MEILKSRDKLLHDNSVVFGTTVGLKNETSPVKYQAPSMNIIHQSKSKMKNYPPVENQPTLRS